MADLIPNRIADLDVNGTPANGQVLVYDTTTRRWVPSSNTGTPGASLLVGSGVPSSSLGSDNDSYIDSAASNLYLKSSGAWSLQGSIQGLPGADGTNGSALHVGSGTPSNTLGSDGDSYIDSAASDLYLKASGAYTLQGSIKGATGGTGPAGASVGIDVTANGLVGDGTTDNSAALQALCDAQTGAATLFFPPGTYYFKTPVYPDKGQISLVGNGMDSTILGAYPGYQIPPLVLGFRRTETGSRSITSTNRPDAFGVLDTSVAASAGVWTGFNTTNNVYAVAVAHPAQVGQRDPAYPSTATYDYYGSMTGFTVQVAWDGTIAAGTNLCGVGSLTDPGPWYLGITTGPDFVFAYRCSDQSIDPGTPHRYFTFPLPAGVTGPLYKIRVWLDFTAGMAGAAVNGVDATLTMVGSSFTGLKFVKNRGQYLFYLGFSANEGGTTAPLSGSTVPAMSFYGLKISNTAITTEPANDSARYTNDANAVAWFPGTGSPARHMDFHWGSAADGQSGCCFLCHADSFGGGVKGYTISDLSITQGSEALMMASVLNTQISRCHLAGRHVGLGNLPTVANYPVNVRDTILGGFDAPLSLCQCIARLDNVDFESGGICSARLVSSVVRWNSGQFQFFNANPECVVDVIVGPVYGGAFIGTDLSVDSEATNFSDSVFRFDAFPVNASSVVNLTAPYVSLAGPSAAIVNLRGSGTDVASADISQILCADTGNAALLNTTSAWYGTVDGRQPTVKTVQGTRSANLTVLI